MSRIGNKVVEIPDKVKVSINDQGAVSVEGPKGKLNWNLPRQIKASVADNRVTVAREAETRSVKALHGLSRALVNNMVQGVSEGFTKNLEIEGVGFKAAVQGSNLNLSLGFSHPILFSIPKDIKITVTDNTKISITGIDKKTVGQAAADIRRSLTRAKVCAMPASRSGARKAKPFSNYGCPQSQGDSPAHSSTDPEKGFGNGGTSAPNDSFLGQACLCPGGGRRFRPHARIGFDSRFQDSR
jgi:large subunit ribosomal protein L6